MCKENGPQAIWLNRFWCLMINTTCGLICLLVFIILVHRVRRELDQGNEDATPQKKTTYIITECIEINVIKHQSIYYIAEDLLQNKDKYKTN